jgi:hypothetical protein
MASFFKQASSPFNPGSWGGSDDPIFGGSLGDFIPGIGDARAAANQNAANISSAREQMNFQERMSNSAYQRATADMRSAGINPMLAYSQGGASSPGGSLPSINAESKTGLASAALQAYTGISAAQTAKQQANTQQENSISQIELNKANAANTAANTVRTRQKIKQAAKYEPLDDLGEKATKSIGGILDRLTEGVSSSAKRLGKFMSPSPVKGFSEMQRKNAEEIRKMKLRKKDLY